VTCDDFIQAMQDANNVDLTQFRRWYQQAGTPVIQADYQYENSTQSFVLTLTQHTAATADGSAKLPLVLPVRFELMSANANSYHTELLILNEECQQWTFSNQAADVIPVLLADFSAPAKLVVNYSINDLLLIASKAKDGVARWDAMQQLWSLLVKNAVEHAEVPVLPDALLCSMRTLLQQPLADLAFTAELLTLPGYDTLAEQYEQIPVDVILNTLRQFKQQIADTLQQELLHCYQKLPRQAYAYQPEQTGSRQLQAVSLSYLALAGHENLLLAHYQQADNMTDRLAAIKAAVFASLPVAETMLKDLGERCGTDPQVFDKWASLQAISPADAVFDKLKQLTGCTQFSWTNPNRVRAVYGAFAMQNPAQFHRADGKGYQVLTDVICKLDSINPQLTARLVTPLLSWHRFDGHRQQLIQTQLKLLLALPDISNDLYEKVSRSLS
jgi:aminopeptidase N